jgi:hypothetical protein
MKLLWNGLEKNYSLLMTTICEDANIKSWPPSEVWFIANKMDT